mmetsp:Transcript_21843/g.27836  ORF Transcript_21843/g.27836 Transcript_21843/m.27836 type:complete len:92 (-) Transcript_21843:513-788(-)
MTEQRKAVIKNADMSEDMQQEAVDCASQALSKYNIEKVRRQKVHAHGHFLLAYVLIMIFTLCDHCQPKLLFLALHPRIKFAYFLPFPLFIS